MPYEKPVSLTEYKNFKLDILKELGIIVTKTEKQHLLALENEIQVDNYSRKIIKKLQDKEEEQGIDRYRREQMKCRKYTQ